MRLLRTVGMEVRELQRREPRRPSTGDLPGVARCPACGGELVALVRRGRPAFWCRCPVRRALALGA
jgi:hypothetical protein